MSFLLGAEAFGYLDYIKAHESWLEALNNLFLEDMDEAQNTLINNLKIAIVKKLKNDRKIILVPHGASSFLTNEANKIILNDFEVNDYESYEFKY